MPDIDVAAVALVSPPSSAPQATYTPAVSVRNNGIHARVASGYLQMFDKATGVLLDTWPLLSGSIGAGATGLAYATGVLDLTAAPVGKQLMFSGLVTCDGDQVPANNVLSPCFVVVSAEPPEPPGPVVAHASQHEVGGSDQLSVDGLPGKLAEGQEPTEHASDHEAGGEDVLNVDGLPGQLLEPQATANHDNTRHTTPFATTAELQNHALATTAHADATNLEHIAHKGAASGYAPLDASLFVPKANLKRGWPTIWIPTAEPGQGSSGVLLDTDCTPIMPGALHRVRGTGAYSPPNYLWLLQYDFGLTPLRSLSLHLHGMAQLFGQDGKAVIIGVAGQNSTTLIDLQIPVPAGPEFHGGWLDFNAWIQFSSVAPFTVGYCIARAHAILSPSDVYPSVPSQHFYDALYDSNTNWDPLSNTTIYAPAGVSGDIGNYGVSIGAELDLVLANYQTNEP